MGSSPWQSSLSLCVATSCGCPTFLPLLPLLSVSNMHCHVSPFSAPCLVPVFPFALLPVFLSIHFNVFVFELLICLGHLNAQSRLAGSQSLQTHLLANSVCHCLERQFERFISPIPFFCLSLCLSACLSVCHMYVCMSLPLSPYLPSFSQTPLTHTHTNTNACHLQISFSFSPRCFLVHGKAVSSPPGPAKAHTLSFSLCLSVCLSRSLSVFRIVTNRKRTHART